MTESDEPPSTDRLIAVVADGATEEAVACLDRFGAADTEARKEALRALHELVDDHPTAIGALCPSLGPFLTDDDRAVRLVAAKLCVALGREAPDAVRSLVAALADRLADDGEFYYVRARCAEALGYVAMAHPDVTTPEILADLRLGLEFDEPEVREKLAKALACVAAGDPGRLRHHAASLADHLEDDEVLVRYHLCTALATVGCVHPDALAEARAALVARLTDENAYVRGRAAEALGVLASGTPDGAPESALAPLTEDAEPFVRRRAQFALDSGSDADPPVGTVGGIRETTADAVTDITTPDGDGCQHCGVPLPEARPPMCPRCGAPL